jgi:chemotaxis signal transduction protein
VGDFRSGQYLTFRLGRRELAIWAAAVKGVLPAHEVSVADDGSGSVRTQGVVLPIIDLRARLNLKGGVVGRLPSIIVADTGAGLAAFFVDGISEIVHARARDFRAGKIRIGRPRQIIDLAALSPGKNLREDPVQTR